MDESLDAVMEAIEAVDDRTYADEAPDVAVQAQAAIDILKQRGWISPDRLHRYGRATDVGGPVDLFTIKDEDADEVIHDPEMERGK